VGLQRGGAVPDHDHQHSVWGLEGSVRGAPEKALRKAANTVWKNAMLQRRSRLHGGASLVVSESARSLSSAFLHQALLRDLFIQTIHSECPRRYRVAHLSAAEPIEIHRVTG
jgi:hypothetical protein